MTDFLDALRAFARESAGVLRRATLDIDRDPSLVDGVLAGALPWRHVGMPAEYYPDPPVVCGRPVYLDSCVEQVTVLEELARADAGAVLALPGPAMSGFVVAEMADQRQRERYYGMLAQRPTWTFFGMTEPSHGSDPAGMATNVTDGLLNGVKRFVGNGARARIGVVFARRSAGPLGISAVLIETDRPGFAGVPLETLGLRALQLSELRMRDVPVETGDLLGHHRSATRQGMWAAVRTFNRYRPVVACLALGVAQAAFDYVVDNRRLMRVAQRHVLDGFAERLHGVRALVLAAARSADNDPGDGTLASAAKIRATGLAEEVTTTAVRFFGPGARWEHPLLDKWLRDARAFEFMEGTSNIQRLNLAQGYLNGRLGHAQAA
jgi:acyl-CoA dehydrogenase